MKRTVLSIIGGFSFTFFLAVIPFLLVEVLKLEWLESVAELMLIGVVWPVAITGFIFPRPHDALLFDIQDMALRVALAIDVIVYSLLTFFVIRWRAKHALLP